MSMPSTANKNNVWGWIILIIILVQIGNVLIGGFFKADKKVVKDTSQASSNLSQSLFLAFQDYGQLEVRHDYSLYVYMSKDNYSRVNYPEMDAVISSVSAHWCSDKSINSWYLPKVIYRDIKTGEELKVYRCLLKM